VDACTLFQIGSITKTFTATLSMRLVEENKLDLDTPVRAYLPDLALKDPSIAERVTMRHLLQHTGGWQGDYFADFGRGDDALARIVASMVDLDQVTPLGQVWAYNNAGFYLAGRVIEAVTGTTFESAMNDMLLQPLGLTHSFIFPEEVMLHRFVVGHTMEDGSARVASPWPIPRSANPAGGIVSCLPDMLRYARFHLGDGTAADGSRYLSRESMTLMHAPAVPRGGGGHMAIGWGVTEVDGVRTLGHTGDTIGQIARLTLVPDRSFALILLTNAQNGMELATEITTWALDHYLGLKTVERPHLQPNPAYLEEYAGRYADIMRTIAFVIGDGGSRVELIALRGGLREDAAELPPPSPVAFVAEDEFVVIDGQAKGTTGEFIRDSEGAVRWLRYFGRAHARLE
jgi:CubicO group peptidase (beta-lactamase class C family)